MFPSKSRNDWLDGAAFQNRNRQGFSEEAKADERLISAFPSIFFFVVRSFDAEKIHMLTAFSFHFFLDAA